MEDRSKQKELFTSIGRTLIELGTTIQELSSRENFSGEVVKELEDILNEAVKNITATMQTLKISNFASGLIKNFEKMVNTLKVDVESIFQRGEDVVSRIMAMVKPSDEEAGYMDKEKCKIIVDAYNEFRNQGKDEKEAMVMAINFYGATKDKK